MNFFKKYIMILSVVLSFNSYAIQQTPYEAPDSCQSVVEAGRKLAINDTSGFSSESTLQGFVTCNLEMLPTSLSTEIMYSIFGDAIIAPLSHVNEFISTIYTKGEQSVTPDIDQLELKSYLEDRVTTFPVLIATVEALTFASFQLISFMLGAFSLFYLVNTMTEGTYLGKQVNTFWTFTKIGVVMAMIFPLDGLGLNAIQLVIIFIAFCGSLLASLIWSILPLFKYAYLSEFTSVDDDLKADKDSKSIEVAEAMVSSSICDISARQSLLLKGLKVENFTSNILNDNKMFTCLKSANQIDYKNFNLPFEHQKTMNCAKEEGIEHSVDCGSIAFTEKHNTLLRTKINDSSYTKARLIAIKTLAANCTKNKILQEGDASNYYTYCSDIDKLTFETAYKNNSILTIFPDTEYTQEEYKNDLFMLKNEIEGSLLTNLAVGILESSIVQEELMEKISYALNKGWFNAGTFLFDIGHSTSLKNSEYEAVMVGYSFDYPVPSKSQLNRIENIGFESSGFGDSYASGLEEKYNNFSIKGDIKAINSKNDIVDIFSLNQDLDNIGFQSLYEKYKNFVSEYIENLSESDSDRSIVNKMLFPTLILGLEFNEPDIGSTESCSKDYNNCKKMPINPIATIIDTSRTSAANTGLLLTITSFISSAIDFTDNKITKKLKRKIPSKLHESKK